MKSFDFIHGDLPRMEYGSRAPKVNRKPRRISSVYFASHRKTVEKNAGMSYDKVIKKAVENTSDYRKMKTGDEP